MIINVDSDGVVYDLVSLTQELARREYIQDFPKPTSWGFGNWNISFTEVMALWAVKGAFEHGQPEPGAIQGIRNLLEENHTVRIVTAKHGLPDQAQAMQETIEFYRFHGLLGEVDLVFPIGKQDYPADVIIDDKPNLDWVQKNKVNLFFTQPWNKNVNLAGRYEVVRVAGWGAVPIAMSVLTG